MTKARIREIRAQLMPGGSHAVMFEELIAEVERLQSFTRRGDLPDTATEKGKADPRVKQLIDGFYDAYKQFHGETYVVTPGKDTSAAKRLVALFTVEDLLDTAWEAWKHPEKFACRQALTIAGFASKINEVKVDIKLSANGGRPPQTQPAQCNL